MRSSARWTCGDCGRRGRCSKSEAGLESSRITASSGKIGLKVSHPDRITSEEGRDEIQFKGDWHLTWAILWGGTLLGVGLVNLVWGSYGQRFLEDAGVDVIRDIMRRTALVQVGDRDVVRQLWTG